jgi:hypothetical protein
MKLREVLEPCVRREKGLTMPTDVSPWAALKDAGLLDAEVIGLCKTCGGSRSVSGAQDFPGGDEGYDVTCSPCQDCPDTTWVIAPEAWVAAIEAMAEHGANDGNEATKRELLRLYRCTYEKELGAILQALLPGARVAKSIISIPESAWEVVEREDQTTVAAAPCDIAVLEDTHD